MSMVCILPAIYSSSEICTSVYTIQVSTVHFDLGRAEVCPDFQNLVCRAVEGFLFRGARIVINH